MEVCVGRFIFLKRNGSKFLLSGPGRQGSTEPCHRSPERKDLLLPSGHAALTSRHRIMRMFGAVCQASPSQTWASGIGIQGCDLKVCGSIATILVMSQPWSDQCWCSRRPHGTWSLEPETCLILCSKNIGKTSVILKMLSVNTRKSQTLPLKLEKPLSCNPSVR